MNIVFVKIRVSTHKQPNNSIKSSLLCSYCNKNGHIESKCFLKKRDQRAVQRLNKGNEDVSSNVNSSQNQELSSNGIRLANISYHVCSLD